MITNPDVVHPPAGCDPTKGVMDSPNCIDDIPWRYSSPRPATTVRRAKGARPSRASRRGSTLPHRAAFLTFTCARGRTRQTPRSRRHERVRRAYVCLDSLWGQADARILPRGVAREDARSHACTRPVWISGGILHVEYTRIDMRGNSAARFAHSMTPGDCGGGVGAVPDFPVLPGARRASTAARAEATSAPRGGGGRPDRACDAPSRRA